MARGSAGWAPGRRKTSDKMLELRRSRSDAWEESTEAMEQALQSMNVTAKYLPWLVTSSAGVAILAGMALVYGVSGTFLSGN